MHRVQAQIYFEWHLSYQAEIAEKMVATGILSSQKLHLLTKNSIKNSSNWACTHSLGLNNFNFCECLFILLVEPKFDALWFCHLKSLCKSLCHCKYIRAIIFCCVIKYLNSFLWARNYSCPEQELVADSWEPKAEAKVLSSSFLPFVHQVTLLIVWPSRILSHTYSKLTVCLKMQFRQEQVTWVVSSLHLGWGYM